MLYKSDKGVNNATRPSEDGLAEARGLSASSLPWNFNRPARMPDSLLKSHSTKQRLMITLEWDLLKMVNTSEL